MRKLSRLRLSLLVYSLAILSLVVWFGASDLAKERGTRELTPRVLNLGNQFDSSISEVAEPFEKLIVATNQALLSFSNDAAKYDLISAVLAWFAVALSVAITIIAAMAGIDPIQAQTPGPKTSRAMKIIAILAALSSCTLVVDGRITKIATEAKANSKTLYEKATAARRALLSAGTDSIAAEAAKESLFLALTEIGRAPH